MNRSFLISTVLLCLVGVSQAIEVDLCQIQPIAPKGRVQDRTYNPNNPPVASLIAAGTAAIPFLVSKLDDDTPINSHVLDFWRDCTVGDVAWIILCDFFTASDGTSTIQPALDSFVPPDNGGAYAAWQTAIQRFGRKGIKDKVTAILRPYDGKLAWDPKELCFRPTK